MKNRIHWIFYEMITGTNWKKMMRYCEKINAMVRANHNRTVKFRMKRKKALRLQMQPKNTLKDAWLKS
jgi:hypothetical protein